MYLFLLLLTNVPYILSQSLSDGITNLAMELSSRKENSEQKNFVLSPYSIHSAFSQLLLGSSSNTKSELEKVLGIRLESTSEYTKLRNSLESGDSIMKVANLMALAKGFKPNSQYTQDLKTRFGSEVKELDFAGDKANSVKQVNKFVSSATNGKIKNLLKKSMVDKMTKLILVNAVYFRGSWKFPFDMDRNFMEVFHAPSGPVKVEYMKSGLEVRQKEVGSYKILEIPYTDPNKALLIVLPKEGVSSANITKNIRNFNFNEIRHELVETIEVILPRFKIRDDTKLKKLTKSMGLTTLYGGAADLSGISPRHLGVSDAVHQAFIEVTEKGTEASAATAIITFDYSEPERIFVNRPFVFMVYDFQERVPLFLGKVVNPGTKDS